MKTFTLPFLSAAFALASMAGLSAQTIAFSSFDPTPTNVAGASGLYRIIENSVSPNSPYSDDSYSLSGFNVTVGSGTGAGQALVGQDFLALCVNIGYAGPDASTYAYSTDGTGLSYVPENGARDYWATDASAKLTAIRNILAVYGTPLGGMNQNLGEFQEWTVALTLVLNEVVADFGTANFGSLSEGDLQAYQAGGTTALPASILLKYQSALAEINNGRGNEIVLHTATIGGSAVQDVVFFAIPEPSAAMLVGAAALLGTLRRRRVG